MQLFGLSPAGADYNLLWTAVSAIFTAAAFIAAAVACWLAYRQSGYQQIHDVKSTIAQISIKPQKPSLTLAEWDYSPTRDYENVLTEPKSMLKIRDNPDANYVYTNDFVLEAYAPYDIFPSYPVFIFDTPLKITNYALMPCAISIDSSKVGKMINKDSYEAREYPSFIIGDDQFSSDPDELQPILLGSEQSVTVIVRRLVFAGQLIDGTIDENDGSFKQKQIASADEQYSNFMEPMELYFEVDNLTDDGKRIYQLLEDTQWNVQKLAKGIHFLGLGVLQFRLTHVKDMIKTRRSKNWKNEKINNPSKPQQPKNIEVKNNHLIV